MVGGENSERWVHFAKKNGGGGVWGGDTSKVRTTLRRVHAKNLTASAGTKKESQPVNPSGQLVKRRNRPSYPQRRARRGLRLLLKGKKNWSGDAFVRHFDSKGQHL